MKQMYVFGMIVVILLMLWLGSDILKLRTSIESKEGFTSNSSTITLNFCPSWAPQSQTAKGNTDCCQGDMVDGKCNGKTFCSLSPPHDSVPSCLDAWKKYYQEKSIQLCPITMPNYFEDVKNTVVGKETKGCSASLIKENGVEPKNNSVAKCRIYNSEKENRERPDSCFVEKQRLQIKCPNLSGYTSKITMITYKDAGVEKYGSFVCSYTNPLGQLNSCNDEKSLVAMWDRQNPNWRLDTTKYTQLQNISCTTFVQRETQKAEVERKRQQEITRLKEEQAKQLQIQKKKAEEAEKARQAAVKANQTMQKQLNELKKRFKFWK